MMKGQLTKIQAITAAEAARRMRLSLRTVYNWLDSGKLDEVRTADNAFRMVAIDEDGRIILHCDEEAAS